MRVRSPIRYGCCFGRRWYVIRCVCGVVRYGTVGVAVFVGTSIGACAGSGPLRYGTVQWLAAAATADAEIGVVFRLCGVVFVVLLVPFQLPVLFLFFFPSSSYSIINWLYYYWYYSNHPC